MSGFVDLRSDTVTVPTAQMRKAMADAKVGDDCWGDDPTINEIQELAASMLGTQAALYLPTGTLANQVAVKVLSHPGNEVICEADCHLVHYECGATAVLSQVQLRCVTGALGVLDPAGVRAAVRPPDPYQPKTSMVAVENTHNVHGGTAWTLEEMKAIRSVAHQNLLPVYCDGARLFNACAATGTGAADYAAQTDLISISLYKALAAPMGSLLCGSKELVGRAWTPRRIFGGALHQGGVVAAAGLVALRSMVDRIPEDHARARRLAEGLGADVDRVHTNIVLREVGPEAGAIVDGLRSEGVLAAPIAPGVLRFVTHKDVDDAGVDRAIKAFAAVMKERR